MLAPINIILIVNSRCFARGPKCFSYCLECYVPKRKDVVRSRPIRRATTNLKNGANDSNWLAKLALLETPALAAIIAA
jgi:hypothetical protein